MQDFEKLLRVLPPAVAARVYEKYEKDRSEFMQVLQDMTPKKGTEYWANKSCTKCYGRGIIGVLANTKKPVVCRCVDKAYKRFVVDVRKYYNALKELGRHEQIVQEETAD